MLNNIITSLSKNKIEIITLSSADYTQREGGKDVVTANANEIEKI